MEWHAERFYLNGSGGGAVMMLFAKKTTGARGDRGFTIVELLIVVVVIAILAAITIVAYNGITNRSNDTTVQNDMQQSYTRIQNYYNEKMTLPTLGADVNNLVVASRGSYGGGNNFYIYCYTSSDLYAVAGRSKSGNGFAYNSRTGAVAFPTWPGDGNANVCPAAGVPTASPGYAALWIGVNGGWESWFTNGK